ncbi:MAG: copper resistance protein CopC [Betaproteobacteria bacterium]|nr:copper resistance protein CopC [Betaproteobacteria bacterium]
MTRRRWLIGAVAWGVILHAPLAWAHAKLLRSEPAARSVLRSPPTALRLWFNERIEAAFSSVEVRDAASKVIATGKISVDASDPKRMQMDLPPLIDGVYAVHYRVLSVDGHVIRASFKFTVRVQGQ